MENYQKQDEYLEALKASVKLILAERTAKWAEDQEKGLLRRFLNKINKTDACWIWIGGRNRSGYGRFVVWNKNSQLAHRFSWTLHKGLIMSGLDVLHKCDNPPCVNPEHLFLGTQADNNRDMRAKGRGGNPPKGLFIKRDEFTIEGNPRKSTLNRYKVIRIKNGICLRCSKKKEVDRMNKNSCLKCTKKQVEWLRRKNDK